MLYIIFVIFNMSYLFKCVFWPRMWTVINDPCQLKKNVCDAVTGWSIL